MDKSIGALCQTFKSNYTVIKMAALRLTVSIASNERCLGAEH